MWITATKLKRYAVSCAESATCKLGGLSAGLTFIGLRQYICGVKMWSKLALEQFAKWGGLTGEQAADAGLFEVESAAEIYPDFDPLPAVVIPYYAADRQLVQFERDGEELPFCRLRYLVDPPAKGFTKQKPKRYAQPGKSGTRVYFPRCLDWRLLTADVQEPLIITEGEAKALVAAYAGLPCMALGGVYSFMQGVDDLLPELEAIKWRGREVLIVFDSDAASNPNVIAAEARLVDELMRKRGAKVTIIRLPPDGDNKEALDTFLEKFGPQALVALLEKTQPLGTLDAKVIALNKSLAWIESDGLVWDLDQKGFIKKDNLITGSRWGSIHHITVGAKQRSDPKKISVAAEWLRHPHAQRFGDIIFRPGEDKVVSSDSGRPALNIWTGWEPTDGDVTPFLELNDFLFKNMPPEHRDIPLKLMAYKAQHPAEKVPLALVLLGPQGCGKSMWGEIMRDAFAPYGFSVDSSQLVSEFQGWIERSLVAVMDEAKGEDMFRGADKLKGLISDLRQPMNEKFRPVRQVNSYTLYILTSNRRSVGSFSADDRRMIVVDCPKPKEPAFYHDYVRPWWKPDGANPTGARALLGYLLKMDLKGWRPPAKAPMTPEKYLAFTEGLTTVQALAEEMKTADEHAVKRWLDQAYAWADTAINSNSPSTVQQARAISDAIGQMQIRPWYEARELALMFPSLTESLLGAKYDRTTPPGKISRELREAGVPYLVNKDDPRGFHWHGMVRQYLIVYDFDEWAPPMTQIEFERFMAEAPTYAAIKRQRRTA
jgi:hypothetical protein